MADARTGAAGEAVLLADDAHAVRSGIDGVDGAYTLAGPAGDAGIFVDAPGAQSRAGTQAQEASEGADAVVPEGLFKKEGNEGGEGREYGQDGKRRARSLYDNHEDDKEGEEDEADGGLLEKGGDRPAGNFELLVEPADGAEQAVHGAGPGAVKPPEKGGQQDPDGKDGKPDLGFARKSEDDEEGEEDGGNKDAEKAFRVAVLRWLHEWPPPTAERTDVT